MEQKNTLLLTVVAVATLLVAVVGATFAYFTAQTGTGQQANVTVTTSTSDSLEYGTFGAITINATQENFGQDDTDLTGTTTGNVTLKANADAAATYCYTASLNITSNDFEYTTTGNTPELLFSATKNATGVVTNADVTTLNGEGAVNIPTTLNGSTYVHSINAGAGATVSDAWSASVTFKNLDSDQQENTNKRFTAVLKFTTTACQ